MTINEVSKTARQLMDQHDLKDWRIEITNHKTSFGKCYHSKRVIGLSSILLPHCNDSSVINTITHEIAHALVGPRHKHDMVWRNKHISLGGDGERTGGEDNYEDGREGQDKVREQHSNYVAVCKNGHNHYRNKLSRREFSCSICCSRFNREFLLVFKRNPKKIR
jgi:hypothetical protein